MGTDDVKLATAMLPAAVCTELAWAAQEARMAYKYCPPYPADAPHPAWRPASYTQLQPVAVHPSEHPAQVCTDIADNL